MRVLHEKYTYGENEVYITDFGSRVVLADGREIIAAPEKTKEYEERARSLGYKSGLAMCQDHDWMHCILANALGMKQSPALTRAADSLPINELAGAEEDAVLAIQRFLNLWRKENEVPF